MGIEGGQSNRHVRGMRGDARLRGAQDGQFAVIALAGRAAAARLTLVAGLGNVLEVDAARALQQVPTGGGQVAQLARSTS
jgi:pantothenate kinase